MEWVASTLDTTSEHGVSSITTADAHTSAASSRLIWSPCRFKWTRPFGRKTKSGFCACAITFQTRSTYELCFTISKLLYFMKYPFFLVDILHINSVLFCATVGVDHKKTVVSPVRRSGGSVEAPSCLHVFQTLFVVCTVCLCSACVLIRCTHWFMSGFGRDL